MAKIKVYIDFEAISAPFSYKLKIPNDTPYAYSLGIHVDKKFIHRTKILDFSKIVISDLDDRMRLYIMDDIRDILKDRSFAVNRNSIEFVSWAPNLEKKILSRCFKGIKVNDQVKGKQVSLSALTKEEFKGEYFKLLKEEVNKNLEPEFIENRGLNKDGALAALAGYQLYADSRSIPKKWQIHVPVRALLKEITLYSADDVIRMSWLELNKSEFDIRLAKQVKINAESQKNARTLIKLNAVISMLRKSNQKLTIAEVLKIKEKERQELVDLKNKKK